jgi:hypothetical protein
MTKIRMVRRRAGFVLVTGGSPSGVGVGKGTGVTTGVGLGMATGDGEGVGAEGVDPPQPGRTINETDSTSQLFLITPRVCRTVPG